MKQLPVLLTGCAFALVITTPLRAEDPAFVSTGPGVGALIAPPSSDCAPLIMHTDGTYENGVAWKDLGVAPPYWGAFAESFAGPLDVCGLVFDLTQLGYYVGQATDVYIWNDHLGQPGSVRYVAHDVDLGTIAVAAAARARSEPNGSAGRATARATSRTRRSPR